MHVLTIFGTRPEALKMAPVVNALAAEDAVHSVVCVTAQHRQMLDQVLQLFAIRPDHDLDLIVAGQTLNIVACLLGRSFDEFEPAPPIPDLPTSGDGSLSLQWPEMVA